MFALQKGVFAPPRAPRTLSSFISALSAISAVKEFLARTWKVFSQGFLSGRVADSETALLKWLVETLAVGHLAQGFAILLALAQRLRRVAERDDGQHLELSGYAQERVHRG